MGTDGGLVCCRGPAAGLLVLLLLVAPAPALEVAVDSVGPVEATAGFFLRRRFFPLVASEGPSETEMSKP